MDKLSTLISLNEAKNAIDEIITKVKKIETETEEQKDSRKILIIVLALIGALVVVALIAWAVYKHFSDDYLDDYEDLDDIFEDEEEVDAYEDEDEVEDDEPEVLVSEDDFAE